MDPSPTEKVDAAAIVEWVLGVATRRPPQDGHADFDLADGDKSVGALHVVRGATSAGRRAYRIMCGAPELERSWLLDVAPGVDVGARQPAVRTLLRRAEWSGTWCFSPLSEPLEAGAEGGPVLDALAALGVVAGVGVDAGEHPPVVRIMKATGGLASPHHVNDIVGAEARRAGVQRRLQDGRGETHLFVWIGDNDLVARSAMEADTPPEPPDLPAGLTSVWVSRRPATDRPLLADRLWQTDEAGEWQALSPIRKAVARPAVPA